MTSQNMRQENPEHKLTPSSLESEKLRNLYVKIALPMAFGMVLSGLYNMVDAYFIAQYVGDIGFAAVSAIFPLQMLVIALGAFISNGVSIVVSQYWGAGQNSKAQTVINNAFTLVLLLSIVLAILALSATSPFLRASGVTDLLFDDARAYFIPVTMGAVLVLSLSLITDLLRAQTKMQSLLLIIILGAVSNVILDYLFIAVFNFGVSGAAYATIICQLMGLLLGIRLLNNPTPLLSIEKLSFALNFGIINKFLSIGMPVFISYFGAAVVMVFINTRISQSDLIGSTQWLAAYGIVSRINIFLILPLIAISHASQTIIAHNYGAKNFLRVKNAAITGAFMASSYLAVMTLCLQVFPRQIITVFSPQESVLANSETIIGTMFMLLPLAGVSAICIAFFQATGRAKKAMLLSSAQIYVFLLPAMIFISAKFELSALWYAFPLTHVLSALLAISLVWTHLHRLIPQSLGSMEEKA